MQTTLRQHQLALLEMLEEIDGICRKWDIHYVLFAGTALGAVRHRGFIPWDDDLDVLMPRRDYEKFLEVAPQSLNPARYFLQAEFGPHWPMFFSKLRQNGTTCLERCIPRDSKTHQGIYVDIFPCDNLSDHRWLRPLQFLASKVVIAKSLRRRGYRTDSLVKKAWMALCILLPQEPFRRLTMLKSAGDSRMVHCFFGGACRYGPSVFPREWVRDALPLPFEGRLYPVSARYDALLTRLYGNYRLPTPEENRDCKRHAVLVDLHQPYEAYLDTQKTMTFRGYTRSIR